jgi:serine/threonine-protein kinase
MGEVYRAYDLILDQTVALKFLPQANVSEAALLRFRNEVRIARQVSHPNVCRVYDIGFVEGQQFLSMEYLDGEDLRTLLRRIGRLPQDKAIEFTNRICAGLAAAHERGVLHRDLKPSNIMIEGRGQVRITDFGLAVLAAEIPLSDLRSGTPAYMSPEQKSGHDVSTRSDLYALGLVMYEMFTGKQRDPNSAPAELVKDLDPAIERLILWCLEEDPRRRPQSVIQVAMALPGADPIAAALAAGETPSPEMVAASQEREGLSRRAAKLCFAAIVFSVAALHVIPRGDLLVHAPLEIPPEALTDRVQAMIRGFGYTAKPRSSFHGFGLVDASAREYVNRFEQVRRNAMLATRRPAILGFWYRQHSSEIVATSFPGGTVTFDSPANDRPGMIRAELDSTGRLLALEARPDSSSAGDAPAPVIDWNALLIAGGFDPARFTPVSPQQAPPVMADAQMAWTGTFGPDRTEQVHVEAAMWKGRPVYFQVAGDWQRGSTRPTEQRLLAAGVAVGIGILLGACLLARRNLRQGRSDRRGAARIAGAMFMGWMCAWILTADHASLLREPPLLIGALSFGAFLAGLYGAVYLAVEPYVRRYWPDALIPLTRVLAGRIRDPLVASNIIAGILLTQVWALCVFSALIFLPAKESRVLSMWTLEALTSASSFWGILILAVGLGASWAGLLFFVLLLVRIAARRGWIADGFVILLIAFFVFPLGPLFVMSACMLTAAGLWSIRRFGLVAFLSAGATMGVGTIFSPFWHSPGSWYADRALILPIVVTAAAWWGLWVILSSTRRTRGPISI